MNECRWWGRQSKRCLRVRWWRQRRSSARRKRSVAHLFRWNLTFSSQRPFSWTSECGNVGIGSHSNGNRVSGAILEEGSVRKQIRRVGFYVEEIIFVWPRAEIPVITVGGGVGDGILVAMRKLLEQAAISTWVFPPKKKNLLLQSKETFSPFLPLSRIYPSFPKT